MKTLISILLLLIGIEAQAGLVSSNLFTLGTINNTTSNGVSVVLGSAYLQPATFFIQSTGLSNTNAMQVNIQLGLDGTNFSTVLSYKSSSTNAAIDAVTLTNSAITIYVRAQFVTTNSVVAGASVVKQQ